MSEYEFIFIVDGIALDDHAAVRSLTDEMDVLLSCFHGVHRMAVTGEGPDAVAAAGSVVARARKLVPGMRLLRLDRELVGVPDIAERTERTRQNVTQWVRGQRHDGASFPPPEGTIGRSLVWLWSEVNAWLGAIGLDDGENRPTRAQMVEIDWLLQHGAVPVELNLSIGSGRAEVERIAMRIAEHARSTPRFIDYLRRHPQVQDTENRYTIVVCSPDDEVDSVFRTVETYPHPVVLATITTGIYAQVMSRGNDNATTSVELSPGTTVRDWIDLIALSPDREFSITVNGDLRAIAAESPLELASA